MERACFPLSSAKLDQPGSDFGPCVMWMLLSLCRWDLKGSQRFGGCLHHLGPLKFPTHFYVGVCLAGTLRQGQLSSALSRLCLLHVEINGRVSLGSG